MSLQRACFRMMWASIAALSLLLWSNTLMAQVRDTMDLRGKSYSTEDLGKALFPEPTMQTRGIGPTSTATPAPEKSVAMNVLFETNSATIRSEFYPDLDKLGAVLNDPKYQAYRIEIEGHTDSIGSEDYNLQLSAQRAQSVRHYLVNKFAIDPQRLMIQGYGEDRPITGNTTSRDRRKNRRVEVVNRGQ